MEQILPLWLYLDIEEEERKKSDLPKRPNRSTCKDIPVRKKLIPTTMLKSRQR